MEQHFFSNQELNTLPCGIVAFANHSPWNIIYANDMYYSHFSNNNSETLNIFGEDAPSLNSLAPRLAHSDSADLLYRAVDKNDNELKIVMRASRYGADAYLGVLWDATDRSKMIEEVQAEKEKFAVALCNSKNVVFEHNLKNKTQVFYVPDENTNTVETIRKTGVDGATVPYEDVHPDYREFFMKNIFNPEEKMLAARLKLPHDTEYKWYRINRQFQYDDDGELMRVFGVMINIDKEKQMEKERIEESEIDPSLGIYFRNAAVKKITKYLNDNKDRRDYALMVLDIDNFKSINDTYGHLYGDTVIEMVAQVLKDLRPNFYIPGRYGGDEFFAFIYSADKAEIKEAADKILEQLSAFRLSDGRNVTASIGISLGVSFEEPPAYKEMFERADSALYEAKRSGKARWKIYDESMSVGSGRGIDYEVDEDSDAQLATKDLMKVFLEFSASAKTSEGAIYSILRYMTAKFDFDWMQVMQVNTAEDLITIKYEWSRIPDFRNNAGKSGYYVHSDIMLFRNFFENKSVFEIIPENTKDFSPKFQREFEKNSGYNIIYIADTTADENFYMFSCVRFDKDKVWTKEELEGLNTATKIMTMFIAQSGKESQRELELQKQVNYDEKTGLFHMGKFYEQLGRLRKLATENDERVVLLHSDFGNFIDFNRKFGYREGDNVIQSFAQRIKGDAGVDRTIAAHVDSTDCFLSALRMKEEDLSFIEKQEKEDIIFCEKLNEKYPGANLVLRVGVYILPPGEEGGIGFDKALIAKKKEKDRDRTFYAVYKEE